MGPHNVRLEPPLTCDCRYEFTHKVRIPLKRRTSLLSHTAAIVSQVIPHPQGPQDVTRPLSIPVAFYGGSVARYAFTHKIV